VGDTADQERDNEPLGVLYRSFLQDRLRGQACESCGRPLEGAVIVSAGDGTTHDEHRLSARSVALLLAATESLRVQCEGCGALRDVGVTLVRALEAPSLSGEDTTPWGPGAVAAYRAAIRSRLTERRCSACQAPLGAGVVKKTAAGSTLPEHGFDDEVAAAIIAWTQWLTVECPECGALGQA
jgi:hypothetical protein